MVRIVPDPLPLVTIGLALAESTAAADLRSITKAHPGIAVSVANLDRFLTALWPSRQSGRALMAEALEAAVEGYLTAPEEQQAEAFRHELVARLTAELAGAGALIHGRGLPVRWSMRSLDSFREELLTQQGSGFEVTWAAVTDEELAHADQRLLQLLCAEHERERLVLWRQARGGAR